MISADTASVDENIAGSYQHSLLVNHCKSFLLGKLQAHEVLLDICITACIASNADFILEEVAASLMQVGTSCNLCFDAPALSVAEELLQGQRGLLRIAYDAAAGESVLWRHLREFLGVSVPDRLFLAAGLASGNNDMTGVDVVDPRTLRTIVVRLRDFIGACKGVRCAAVFTDPPRVTTPLIKPAIGHIATVDGIPYEEFLAWVAEPTISDSAILLSTLHSHQTQLADEPGLTPSLLPIADSKDLFASFGTIDHREQSTLGSPFALACTRHRFTGR